MNIRLLIVFIVINVNVFSLTELASGQSNTLLRDNPNEEMSGTWSVRKLSLFDKSRFSMNQSYSMFYMSGAQSGTYGMYSNILTYQLADPLQIKLRMNYLMRPSVFRNNSAGVSSGQILPALSIQYHPKKNIYLYIHIDQNPNYGYHSGPWGMFNSYPY